jgi:hypothetical protein
LKYVNAAPAFGGTSWTAAHVIKTRLSVIAFGRVRLLPRVIGWWHLENGLNRRLDASAYPEGSADISFSLTTSRMRVTKVRDAAIC